MGIKKGPGGGGGGKWSHNILELEENFENILAQSFHITDEETEGG